MRASIVGVILHFSFEGVCVKLPSSWPRARVEGGSEPQFLPPLPPLRWLPWLPWLQWLPRRVPKTQNLLLFTVLSRSRGPEIGPGRVEGLEKFKKSNFQLPKGPCGHDIRSTGLEKPFKISSRQLKMKKCFFMKKWNLYCRNTIKSHFL